MSRVCRDVTSAIRRFRMRRHGRCRVELRVGDKRVRSAISVDARRTALRKALPTLLATGDSTTEGVESFLADDLAGEASVDSDVRPGTGSADPTTWAPVATSRPTASLL